MISWQLCALMGGLILLDYITGIVAGTLTDGFSSGKMREGLWHKASYVCVIALSVMLDASCNLLDLGISLGGLTIGVCSWIGITEVGSILENLVKINPELGNNAFMGLFKSQK